MKKIPETENALVLRTDFSDEAAWKSACAAIEAPVGEYRAYVEFVSDPDFEGVTEEEVSKRVPQGFKHTFLFLVDRTTLTHPEHPVLVLNLSDEPERAFRVIPSEMWGVENNLSIANMDFAEFAENAEVDGIFRGFPDG